MNIKHHLDDATLVSYAAGSLSQGMALVVASHLSMCNECQQRMQQAEAIGGLLLEELTPAEPSSNALEAVLARLDEPVAKPEPVKRYRDTPAPLAAMLGKSVHDISWKKMVAGISYYDLDPQKKGVSRLLKIAPGKSLLPHSHEANELTLVLSGSFTDDIGRFCAGDIADLDEQVEHQPLVDGDVDCICLVATDAPLKFSTLLGKLVQPMTGF